MTDFRDEQDRGAKAAAVLRDPLVISAFAEIRSAYVDAWAHTDPADTEFREQLFCLMKALESFEVHFQSAVQTGKMASTQMEELRK
jgi:hypothetical protein|tara:strand:+ start:287 stop:544 length:258 start_codon:yes stop_codon:yes gene_type:complete